MEKFYTKINKNQKKKKINKMYRRVLFSFLKSKPERNASFQSFL